MAPRPVPAFVEVDRKETKPVSCLYSNHDARSLKIIIHINVTFKICTEHLNWEFLPN